MPEVTEEMKKRLAVAFKLGSIRGLEYLKKRGENLIETWDYDDLHAKMHYKSFTVAKTMGADVLQDIFDAVQKAKKEGTPVKDFISNLKPILESKGWWGKKEVDGKIVTLGTPSRLALILDTNIKTSYAQGRWESMMNIAQYRPWFVYEQIHRETARESHKQFDKHIYHYTNPIVQDIFPPRGYGCDCSMRAVTEEEKNNLVARGYVVVEGKEDNKYVTDDMKNFDPIGKYEPEIRDYQKQIKGDLKQALNKNTQIEQKNTSIATQTRILGISNELSNIKTAIENKNIGKKEISDMIFKLNLVNQQLQKLKNNSSANKEQLKKLTVSYTALLIMANKLRK
ncbi:hypothetical protein D9V86_09875 [Bacteroidetes/Chlorobi group bacterium ChocPot_Mid]|nr:MAG: hypothetical protein D9V86_09875 [Bacteroidetes/Chlorobi group bacterium ChocPot_Mid]